MCFAFEIRLLCLIKVILKNKGNEEQWIEGTKNDEICSDSPIKVWIVSFMAEKDMIFWEYV